MLWSLSGVNAALIHYGFESFNLNEIMDDSGNNINAVLVSGAHVTKTESKCGAAIDLDGGEIVVDNRALRDRQIETITIAMWLKLRREEENLSLFNIDPSTDGHGAVFILEVVGGKIHWSHQDFNGIVIFDLLTNQRGAMPQGLWTHVAATYDSHKGQAKLYLDTQHIKSVQGAGRMSSKFRGKISLSKDGSFPGVIDEFYMFAKALSYSDITDLSELCDISGDYQIPMDKGAYSGIASNTHVKSPKYELGHRHSNIDQLSNAVDKSGEDENIPDQCKRQAVFYSSEIRGGKTAGIFSDVGDTLTIEGCIRRCCASSRCHLAYLEKKRCYNVLCHFPSLCQPVKAGKALVTLGYVVRNGRSIYQPEVTTIRPSLVITSPTIQSTRRPDKHTCLQSMVYYGVALRGGWTSGKFSDRGIVASLKKCIELCCKDMQCDLVMLLSQKCFTIHCYNLQDCQTIPNGHAQIAYVTRDQMTSAMVDPFPTHLKTTHRLTHPTHRVPPSVNLPTHKPDKTSVPTISGKRSDMILHLSFERLDEEQIMDDSGFANNARLTNDVNISPQGGIRGNGVMFQGGEILLDGRSFSPKPEKAITIALWVKLNVVQKKHSLFTTIDKDLHQSYYFEIVNRRIIWKHVTRGERVFSAETGPIIKKFTWQHLVVTYDSDSGEVKIYVDGKIQSIGIGHGLLSQDWSKRAGFGVYEEGKALDGFLDEIYMYTTALYGDEIGHYVRNFKEKNQHPSSATATVSPHRRVSSTHVAGNKRTHRPTPHTTRHKPTHHPPPKPTHHITPKWGNDKTTDKLQSTIHITYTGTIPGVSLGPTLTRKPKGKPTRKVTRKKATPTKKTTTAKTTKAKRPPVAKTTPPSTTSSTSTTTPITTTTLATTTTPTTPKTIARTTTKVKSFLTIKSPTESSICTHGPTYKYADLRGGLSAGNFLDRGLTNGVSTCMDLCCEHKTCDLAYVMSNRCYLVECFTVDMCGIVPKGVNMISPIIGMVKRPGSPQILELSDFVQIKTSTTPRSSNYRDGKCKFGDILNHTAFVGGLRAGNYTNKGQVTTMDTCQDLCCKQKSCDVAVMMKYTCFLVACKTMELCKARPAQLQHFSLLLSYRDRKAEEEEQVIELLKATQPYPATSVITFTTTPKPTTKRSTTRKRTTTTTKPTTHTTTTMMKHPTGSTSGKLPGQQQVLLTKPHVGSIASRINDTSPIIIPEPLKPNKNVLSWCLPSFIIEGVELRAGLDAGPYYALGQVDNMDVCMRKCCEIPDCTTAYFDEFVCYAIRCLDKNLCKAKISGPKHKVGYVIRNGWTLFKKNDEVLQDATIAVDQTTTITTTIDPLLRQPSSFHRNQTQVGNIIKLPMNYPTLPSSSDVDSYGYCKPKNTFVDHRLIGGMKSGVFTEHGTVNDFQSCVTYCCRDKGCDLAYQVGLTCYSIKCYNTESCRTFSVPKFFLNPIIAFVTRDPHEPMKESIYNISAPTMKHPYNVKLKLLEKETFATNTRIPLSDQGYARIIPESFDPDYITSTAHSNLKEDEEVKNIMPYGEQRDLGTKREKGVANTMKKIPTPHKGGLKPKGNKKGIKASSDWTKSKDKKEGKGKRGKKKQKSNESANELSRKKSKTNDIASIFSKLLGEDASGSGNDPFDNISGSGFAEKLQVIESNFMHSFEARNLLSDEKKKKKKKKNGHAKKKKKKPHHSSAEKKDKENKPQSGVNFMNDSMQYSAYSDVGKHFAMNDVDIELIQALSPDADYTDCDPSKYDCEHYCIALFHGGFRCICKEGYRLALDGKHCLYEGACDAHAHHCNQKCKYNNDGFQCTCRSGFVMKKSMNSSCEDMDECSMGINGCSDICINTQGSYICECNNGFVLGKDRMSCDAVGAVSKKSDIARPEESKNTKNYNFVVPAMIISSPNETIINQSHNMLLQCKSFGYPAPAVVWTHGEDFTQPLQTDTRFTFLPGGFMLLQSAFVNDSGRYTCVSSNLAGTDLAHVNVKVNDIDECLSGKNNCQQVCKNTIGSYNCNCYIGYMLDDDLFGCEDVNECNYANNCHQYCWNTLGSYSCGCEDGYALGEDKSHCQDIDECADNNTSRCSQTCNNTIGRYVCTCARGYNLAADNRTCEQALPPKVKYDQASTIHRHQYKKASSYIFLGTCIAITVAVISGSLWYLIRNYKKRWKLEEDSSNLYTPPDGFLRKNNLMTE